MRVDRLPDIDAVTQRPERTSGEVVLDAADGHAGEEDEHCKGEDLQK